MAEQLALTCGLAMAGMDYMTVDISKAPAESGGAFIEMNTSPGLDACIAAGWSEEAIAALALGDELGRIPVSMTVVNAEMMKDKIAALDDSIIADDEGWVCGDVFQIGQLRLQITQSEPWAAIKAALRNRRLHRLHVVCSSEEIQRHGLPLDHFDQAHVLDDGLAGLWLKVIESSSSRLVR
jgi:cyanophycin synthetase